MHWVSATHAISAEVRLYDYLFSKPDPDEVEEGKDYKSNLNPKSLEIIIDAKLEPSLKEAKPGDTYQFERMGYFCMDPDSTDAKPVFNRTVTLRDTWAKIEKKSSADSALKKG
jgi:glutaminyl-tRNA synthetase